MQIVNFSESLGKMTANFPLMKESSRSKLNSTTLKSSFLKLQHTQHCLRRMSIIECNLDTLLMIDGFFKISVSHKMSMGSL